MLTCLKDRLLSTQISVKLFAHKFVGYLVVFASKAELYHNHIDLSFRP